MNMDAHERYYNERTKEIGFLYKLHSEYSKEYWSDVARTLITSFNKYVENGFPEQCPSDLEMLRNLLCFFYQEQALKYDDQYKSVIPPHLLEIFNLINVSAVQKLLNTIALDAKVLHLLLDIIVLHMVFCCQVEEICEKLKLLKDAIDLHLIKENDDKLLNIKFMNCFIDALILQQYMSIEKYEQLRPAIRKVLPTLIQDIKSWLMLKDYSECQLLASFLPKMVEIIDDDKSISSEIWSVFYLRPHGLNNSLSMLCLMADVWFPVEFNCNSHLVQQAMDERFWLLIKDGLLDDSLQQRNQALYLAKRVVDFLKIQQESGLQINIYKDITPLVCIGNDSLKASFEANVNEFFVILEALEEKQKHLVTPVLPRVKKLMHCSIDHESCNNCFHIAWVRCAFIKILQHDNNAIVELGLMDAFNVNLTLYNDEFLKIVLTALNNTYLYEKDADNKEPVIVKHLTELLDHAECNGSDLMNRFILAASKMTWGPVALFYVIHAMTAVKNMHNSWKEDELLAVKSLAETNLSMHCHTLRLGSQIELLYILTQFVTQPVDLVTLANTLGAFPINEGMSRGYLSWTRTYTWITKIVTKKEAVDFLEKISQQMKNEEHIMDLNIKSFSLMIMLFLDGQLALTSRTCPAFATLRSVLDILVGADSRPYANADLRNRAIELIGHLLNFTSCENSTLICELISPYTDAVLRIIFKNLRKIPDNCLDYINIYTSILRRLFTDATLKLPKRDSIDRIEKFEMESQNILEDGEYANNVQRLFAVKILFECLKVSGSKASRFIRPLCDAYQTPMTHSIESDKDASRIYSQDGNLRGRIASEYYKFVASLFFEYVKVNGATNIDWLAHISYLTQVGGKDIFLPVAQILSQLFLKREIKPTELDNFTSIVRFCWESTLEYKECRLVVEELIKLMYDHSFIECKETRVLALEFTNEMMEKSDKIPELCLLLVKGLSQINRQDLHYFYDALLCCLLRGAVPRRDKKIEVQTRLHIVDCYQKEYSLSSGSENTFAAIKAHAVVLLHKLITEDAIHATKLLPIIIAIDDQGPKSKRYFGNSFIHRFKHRIMQVLMILQPALQDGDNKLLHEVICKNMLLESNQPSIRIMQEWLLIRMYFQNEYLRADIWTLFDQAYEKRPSSLCSLISVVYHVAILLPSTSPNLQESFILEAMSHIVPCCVSQQFNVRLYAQVIASKFCNLAKSMAHSMVTEKYEEVYTLLTKSLQHGNFTKNISKVQDDFYFTGFHPIQDYSLQALWYELPRLANVASDEYISPDVFAQCSFTEHNSHPLKLYNLTKDMNCAKVSTHMTNISGSTGPTVDDVDNNAESSNDIQKKFIPWKSMIPNENELGEISEILAAQRQAFTDKDNIILVASLIEKLPNLGGLSRTCEILGVKEFVIASLNHTEHKEFQSLSVSAERLIPLVEVKPHQLRQYLLEKKDIGYTLIGAEQTVNSTNLMNMKFDKKTVLVLGNEKSGIPANLITLLDKCVEIPQLGMVRSLNVHVTGAICLWEYFKQHHSV